MICLAHKENRMGVMRMKNALCRIAALCLAAAILLTGCGMVDLGGYFGKLGSALGLSGSTAVAYQDMEYVRPDMDQLTQSLASVCAAADGDSLDSVIDGILAYYDAYDSFYTNYNLAYIHYCADLTDSHWAEEYSFCSDNSAQVDAGLDQLYYALAASPLREALESEDYFGTGFFDAYEGESLWDAEFLSLMEQEAALENAYYDLAAQALETEYYSDAYFEAFEPQMGALFVELVALRQQIAAYAGYDSYPEFAYDFYFYRDYTPDQAEAYLAQIQQALPPLYREVNGGDIWSFGYQYCSEAQTYAYVQDCAQAMGGTVAEAFALMDQGGLYDIAYGENKYDSSYELFLTSYYAPFVFMNPDLAAYDKLTFAHEFGHFANDYACGGSYAGIDVAEVFSQGMEYLSLCYGQNTQKLEQYKLADCLCVYVEQAAYAAFEHQVYRLTGEDLTLENVRALYEATGLAYGFDSWDWDSRDYVAVTHFFTDPMYIISYVVSNDAAFQLYQMEKAEKGAGLARYQECLTSEEAYFLAFVDAAGLRDPFQPGSVEAVRQTLEESLGY